MSRRGAREPTPRAAPPTGHVASATEAFDRWLDAGLAPDERDRAAGRLVADAWRERRRAFDRARPESRRPDGRWRRAIWWGPLALVAISAVVVVAWPSPIVVDQASLTGAYLEAMGALPAGAP